MPITRKPKAPVSPSSSIDIDALINRGGSIANPTLEKEAGTQKQNADVNLRIPHLLLERIDQTIESQTLKIPRHTWILQALLEKLERDGIKEQ